METAFTPIASLGGGLLIGLSAVLLMLVSGRIMGATGLLSGAIFEPGGRDWRLALIAGMATAPLILLGAAGAFPTIDVPVSRAELIAGGVLVGVGVTFGGGCTSGHGVCGLARLSRRSFAATVTFMATAVVTVTIIRHVFGG